MAAEDLTREGNNNQKRAISVAYVEGLTEAQILTTGCIPFTLPYKSQILRVSVYVSTVSTTGSSTVDVLCGTDVVCNEIAVTAAGLVTGTLDIDTLKRATGGDITIKAGSTTPAAGDLICDLIVEYVEYDKWTGEYTNMTMS